MSRAWMGVVAAVWCAAFINGQSSVRPASGVVVDASVSIHGEPLTDLRQDDFVLKEDRTRRLILAMASEDLPLDIVLVYPRTLTGTEGPRNGDPRSYYDAFSQLAQFAATTILQGSGEDDRVGVVSYGIEPRLELPLSHDRRAIAATIRGVGQSVKGSELRQNFRDSYEVMLPAWLTAVNMKSLAIDYAVQVLLNSAPPGVRRRLIVMVSEFSPGPELEAYAGSADEPVIERLWNAGVLLTAVGGGVREPLRDQTRRQPVDATYRRNNPMHIALATGGEALAPSGIMDASELAGLLPRARRRYVLSFSQPEGLAPDQERAISVELSPEARKRYPDAVVHARQGYVSR